MIDIHYRTQTTSQADLHHFLIECDSDFEPKLSSEVDLYAFSEKIYKYAVRLEAWSNKELIGLLSVYLNNKKLEVGFINHISVKQQYKGKGIGASLMKSCSEYAKKSGFKYIRLEVANNNIHAKSLYNKHGFTVENEDQNKLQMMKNLQLGES